MKLIRLFQKYDNSVPGGDGNYAYFNNNFQADIVLKPDSQIALQSVAIDSIDSIFTIDDTNNTVFFGITQLEEERTFRITNGDYNNLNKQDLFDDLIKKFNLNMIFTNSGTNGVGEYYMGVEWNVGLTNNKIVIEYGVNPIYWNVIRSLQIGSLMKRQTVDENAKDWEVSDNDYTSGGFSQTAIDSKYISRGCGLVRSQPMVIIENGTNDPNSNGYLMGLTLATDKTPTTISLDDIKYGIQVSIDAGTPQYYVILNGTRYGPTTTTLPTYTQEDDTNDIIEVIKVGNKIKFNIYQDGTTDPIEINDDPGLALPSDGVVFPGIDIGPMYPTLTFFGGADYVSVRNWITTQGHFGQSFVLPQPPGTDPIFGHAFQPELDLIGENYIEFATDDIAGFLGYNSREVGQFNSGPGGIGRSSRNSLGAQNVFNTGYVVDDFLVELKNLPLDSYDGLKEQRKNVLAYISFTENSGQFNYEVNNPIFINLNNKKELLLRNIEAELKYGDYNRFPIKSNASMTLLIKDRTE